MLHCQQNRDIVVVDLFAGAGGLSLGLEAAGFKVAVAVEKDAINCEVYQKNFPIPR
jgi:DNA (cytosine-5)-methyltransferase 1